MKKTVVLIVVLALAVIFAVRFGVGYASGIGKDTITLTSGEIVRRHVVRYRSEMFYFESKYDMETLTRRVEEIRRISFSGQEKRDSPDTATFESGETFACRVLSYSRGRLEIRMKDGRVKSGGVKQVKSIVFPSPD